MTSRSNGLSRSLIALAFAVLAPATLAAKPTILGTNYQETTDTLTNNPPNGGACTFPQCYFVFSRVPTGKQLVITHVSCGLELDGTPYQAQLVTQRPNGTQPLRRQHLRFDVFYDAVLVIDSPTLQLFQAGDRPLIRFLFLNGNNHAGDCTIAGQISDAP